MGEQQGYHQLVKVLCERLREGLFSAPVLSGVPNVRSFSWCSCFRRAGALRGGGKPLSERAKQLKQDMASNAGTNEPLITIGLPVFNGERFLRCAIDALLAQTYRNFELIIADNASTDNTFAIAQEYADRDNRVHLVRHPRNIGAAKNWNCIVPMARGRYFKWASSNDYVVPTMLADCLAAMQADVSLVLCAGGTTLIDETGSVVQAYDGDVDAMHARPSERFKRVRRELALNNVQSGLIRTDALRKTRLERVYPGGDLVLVAELALLGRLRLLPQPLFFRRIGAASSTNALSDSDLKTFWNPAATSSRSYFLWRMHFDSLYAVSAAPIPMGEKLRAAFVELRNILWHRRQLWQELRR